MADGAIDAARRAAIERNGDVLALRALDRAREAAYARGDVRTRRPSAARTFEEARSRETHDADEPLAPPFVPNIAGEDLADRVGREARGGVRGQQMA